MHSTTYQSHSGLNNEQMRSNQTSIAAVCQQQFPFRIAVSTALLPQQMNQTSLPFPWKLHEMLDSAQNLGFDSVVSWLPQQNGFRVHNTKKFVDMVMPRYFNQTKYKSFQRQLNMWGFERIQSGPRKGGYVHQNFIQGEPSLCRRMRRQKIKGVAPSKAKSMDHSHGSTTGGTEVLVGQDSGSKGVLPRQEGDFMEFEGRTFFSLSEWHEQEEPRQCKLASMTTGSRRCSLGFLVPSSDKEPPSLVDNWFVLS